MICEVHTIEKMNFKYLNEQMVKIRSSFFVTTWVQFMYLTHRVLFHVPFFYLLFLLFLLSLISLPCLIVEG